MYILKSNKISLNVPEVPGTRFSNMKRCNYINLCHFTSIHVKKYAFG